MKIISFVFVLLACSMNAAFAQNKLLDRITPIPGSKKVLDIPKYDSGHPFIYWHYCKQKQTQLNLHSPETSSDSLVLRVWLTVPSGKKDQRHDLFEMRYKNNQWTAQVVNMSVDIKKRTNEVITDFSVKEVQPVANWSSIVDSLFYFKIDSLPTDERLPNYSTLSSNYANRAPTFSFEYATPDLYRFYQYNDVWRLTQHYREAEQVIDFINMLDREFHLDSLSREFRLKRVKK
jgi:hypothetical protein